MKIAYDFHIHTAASPCADDYMSPNNIINMAKLNGLQVIAITDHNTCANCEVIMKLGEEHNLLVIPGMEIECMEEFHCIALFPDLTAAKDIEKYIEANMPKMKNRIDIFGHQSIMNENDEVVGEIERLLLTASAIPAADLFKQVKGVGGIIYPAHIDRNSYSILSNLGFIPEELDIHTIEISKSADRTKYQSQYEDYIIVQSSDAHYLQDILETDSFLEIQSFCIVAILEALKSNKH